MSTETRSALATAFAVLALLAALASTTVTGIVALGLPRQIQDSRFEGISRACKEQNQRNRKAYVFLSGLPTNPNGPKLSRDERIRLIHGFTDALVGPVHSDCSAYAQSVVHP